jgi:hypothetical protein
MMEERARRRIEFLSDQIVKPEAAAALRQRYGVPKRA